MAVRVGADEQYASNEKLMKNTMWTRNWRREDIECTQKHPPSVASICNLVLIALAHTELCHSWGCVCARRTGGCYMWAKQSTWISGNTSNMDTIPPLFWKCDSCPMGVNLAERPAERYLTQIGYVRCDSNEPRGLGAQKCTFCKMGSFSDRFGVNYHFWACQVKIFDSSWDWTMVYVPHECNDIDWENVV
jgi:hypothetical protein